MEYFFLLPLWYQNTIIFLLGLIIGSFLNVCIYRLHTGRSLAGSSHCLSCGKNLRWYELLPVLSYFALRGRCAGCGSHIPARYALVEGLTALLFLAVFSVVPPLWPLVLWLVLVSLLIVIVVYDLYHLIIPDELTLMVTLVIGILFVVTTPVSTATLTEGGLSALAALLVYGGLWLISRGRWIGFGDVKLSLPLAFTLGLWGTFSFVVLSFWAGALISVCLLNLQYLLKRGQRHLPFLAVPLTMKSEVPFAPFLVIAFLLVALYQTDVLVLLSSVVNL